VCSKIYEATLSVLSLFSYIAFSFCAIEGGVRERVRTGTLMQRFTDPIKEREVEMER
jgi:hypothetical protein